MDSNEKKALQSFATTLRIDALKAVHSGKSGHPGGSLSIIDMLAYLYMKVLRVDPNRPDDPERDRFVLSKGHCTPALYAVLANMGYFSKDELLGFRKIDRMLQGHPDMKGVPGVDMSTGSLGQGISSACGMAVGAKVTGKKFRVFTILGDGELQEGQVWEAAMFAASKKLDNLIAIVDNNGLQISGRIEDVVSPHPIDEKFAAFGWAVIDADAHDFDSIEAALTKAIGLIGKGRPIVVIQRSVKGKGVSFMENNVEWHGIAPNDDQLKAALEELQAFRAGLEEKNG